jgi:hypothetical protein
MVQIVPILCRTGVLNLGYLYQARQHCPLFTYCVCNATLHFRIPCRRHTVYCTRVIYVSEGPKRDPTAFFLVRLSVCLEYVLKIVCTIFRVGATGGLLWIRKWTLPFRAVLAVAWQPWELLRWKMDLVTCGWIAVFWDVMRVWTYRWISLSPSSGLRNFTDGFDHKASYPLLQYS